MKIVNNNISDFRDLAKKLLDQQNINHETTVKSRIVPFLLGPYDSISLSEMENVKKELIEAGYGSSIKLQDIQTETSFEGKLDLKFSHMVNSLQKDGFFVIPLFYFPKREDGQRMGHHAELIEIALRCDYTILLSAGLFYHENSNIMHHKRVFLHQVCINSCEKYKNEVIKHVDKFFPIVERRMMPSTKEKSIYTTKIAYKQKRGKKHGAK